MKYDIIKNKLSMFYNIISIMSFAAELGGFFIFMLNYQVHIFHSFAVFCAGGNDINSSCVDTAVTENIRKLCNIFFDAVKCSCEQVT